MPEKSMINTIDEYIEKQDTTPELRGRLKEMQQFIHSLAPQAEQRISWGMPTFYLRGNLVHFALCKNHIGFYPGADGIAHFTPEFQGQGYVFSKGAVQFPHTKPIPFELIEKIVRFRVEENTKQ